MEKVSATAGLTRKNGQVIAVCFSEKKGTPKTDKGEGILEVGFGLKGDAHGGDWHRQVSLLAIEQIETMKNKGFDVKPGSFAENICTEGFDLGSIKVGERLKIGQSVILEVTQIGKECHTRCAIYNKIGECIMPEQGVFATVVEGGVIRSGDPIEVIA
ncbi:MAG: MOSC domain-containing protein [Desulfomonilaceae bacterium]